METSGHYTIRRKPACEHNRILSVRGSKIGINSICHTDILDFDKKGLADNGFGANVYCLSAS